MRPSFGRRSRPSCCFVVNGKTMFHNAAGGRFKVQPRNHLIACCPVGRPVAKLSAPSCAKFVPQSPTSSSATRLASWCIVLGLWAVGGDHGNAALHPRKSCSFSPSRRPRKGQRHWGHVQSCVHFSTCCWLDRSYLTPRPGPISRLFSLILNQCLPLHEPDIASLTAQRGHYAIQRHLHAQNNTNHCQKLSRSSTDPCQDYRSNRPKVSHEGKRNKLAHAR